MRARVIVVCASAVAALAAGAIAFSQGAFVPQPEEGAGRQEAAESVEVTDRVAPEEDVEPESEDEDEPEPEEAALEADAPVVTESSASGVSVTAPEGFLATEEFARVDAEIAALRDRGHTVGVCLLDLQTGRSLLYNADEQLYPASSAKALYCAMVCEANGGSGGMAATMERCLVDSSNEDYEALIKTFRLAPFATWLSEHGAPGAGRNAVDHYYPDISAGELAACWQEIYRFGTSGEAGADELVGYLSRTVVTPIGETLRDECEVWSKAGWFPADENDLASTNDAGVVLSDCGPYVLAVMTDLPADLDGLTPLIDALDAAHDAMCGDVA